MISDLEKNYWLISVAREVQGEDLGVVVLPGLLGGPRPCAAGGVQILHRAHHPLSPELPHRRPGFVGVDFRRLSRRGCLHHVDVPPPALPVGPRAGNPEIHLVASGEC